MRKIPNQCVAYPKYDATRVIYQNGYKNLLKWIVILQCLCNNAKRIVILLKCLLIFNNKFLEFTRIICNLLCNIFLWIYEKNWNWNYNEAIENLRIIFVFSQGWLENCTLHCNFTKSLDTFNSYGNFTVTLISY